MDKKPVGRPKKKEPEAMAKEIIALHGQLEGLVKKSVELIFEIGRMLVEVKEKLEHGQFIPWIEENLPFSQRAAYNYIKVYEQFKFATVANLQDKSITEAYLEAGIKKLTAEPYERPQIAQLSPEENKKRFDEALLLLPVLSSATLRSYRVHIDGSYIVIGRLGMPPMTFGTIDYTLPEEAKEVSDFIRQGFQQVIELGLEKLEALEVSGLVRPPVDESLEAQLRRKEKLTNKRRP